MLFCMNRTSRAVSFPLMLFVSLSLAIGQAPSQSETDAAISTLRTAVGKLDQAAQSKTRFTYLDLNHTLNFNEKGKKTADISQLFEVTYIGDVQYSRLLENEGKPLTGKALEEEQRRYDNAVREHSALDDKARAQVQHQVMKDAGLNLGKVSDYNNTVVDHAVIGGRNCVVIESVPTSESHRKRLRWWLDSADEEIVQMEFEQLTDEGDMLGGSKGRLEWIYMDGIPLLVRSHIDAHTLNATKRVHLVVDHDYSRFRKFTVTSTIVPVVSDDKP